MGKAGNLLEAISTMILDTLREIKSTMRIMQTKLGTDQ